MSKARHGPLLRRVLSLQEEQRRRAAERLKKRLEARKEKAKDKGRLPRFDSVNPPLSELAQRVVDEARAKQPACPKCGDTGWLEAIEGQDGSYITSRPCSCETGKRASFLPR